jgi:hypothetical protein
MIYTPTGAIMRKLIGTEIKEAKPKAKTYKLSDGGGMYLHVHTNGGKYWRMNYRYGGKQKTLSLGTYPDVILEDARIRRDEARKLLADGIDPSEVKQAQKAEQSAARQSLKEAQIVEEARLIAATRFIIDNEGALSFRLGTRYVALTQTETGELRAFLDATRAVTPKVMPCH